MASWEVTAAWRMSAWLNVSRGGGSAVVVDSPRLLSMILSLSRLARGARPAAPFAVKEGWRSSVSRWRVIVCRGTARAAFSELLSHSSAFPGCLGLGEHLVHERHLDGGRLVGG
ncbi:hypothetical protein SMD11_0134 [Streptomyces albireticuli]|uniref:Uncharacterized protein n=1 Tax=Streptomyces albireticuli TaxID=1940 RepID=A0A1Z2KUV6_9ACTN|nr:hypothetical protein SMD11_0134 [Streptomyces albireticuli]